MQHVLQHCCNDVARFSTHVRNYLQGFFFVGGKTRNIRLFNSFCSQKFFVARFAVSLLFPSTGAQKIRKKLVDLDRLTYVKLCSRYKFGHESKPCSVEIAMNDPPRRINHALSTTLQVPRYVYFFRDFFPQS